MRRELPLAGGPHSMEAVEEGDKMWDDVGCGKCVCDKVGMRVGRVSGYGACCDAACLLLQLLLRLETRLGRLQMRHELVNSAGVLH